MHETPKPIPICDRCGKRGEPIGEVRVETTRTPDAAGRPPYRGGIAFDLCAICACTLLNRFLAEKFRYENADEGEAWVDALKLKQRRTY